MRFLFPPCDDPSGSMERKRSRHVFLATDFNAWHPRTVTRSALQSFRHLFLTLVLCQSLVASYVFMDDQLSSARTTTLDASNGLMTFKGAKEEFFHEQFIVKDTFALVGARDTVYNISLSTLEEFDSFEWMSQQFDIDYCLMTDASGKLCHNFIRGLVEKRNSTSGFGEYYVCGTNSLKPRCRSLELMEEGHYGFGNEEDGRGHVPPDADYGSTLLHYDGHPFAGTVFSREPIIYRPRIRTQQRNSLLLNEASFVGSFPWGGKVYFFFREFAVDNPDCAGVMYSRVASVCPHDKGGDQLLKNSWTSFFKSRLNCSSPGSPRLYLDEIQSISELGSGSIYSSPNKESNDVVYAVFTTPRSIYQGSAICAFRMSEIKRSFAGSFMHRRDDISIWQPIVPERRPNLAKDCPRDSLTLDSNTLSFIRDHPLMYEPVSSEGKMPLFLQSSLKYTLTKIAIDWRLKAADGFYYDVVFVGTSDGRIMKMFNSGRDNQIRACLVEILVTPSKDPITGLRVFTDPGNPIEKRLLILMKHKIFSVPVSRCNAAKTCRSCVAFRDPYCSWSSDKCSFMEKGLQSLDTGKHSGCLDGEEMTSSSLYYSSDIRLGDGSPESSVTFILWLILAFVVGLVAGVSSTKFRPEIVGSLNRVKSLFRSQNHYGLGPPSSTSSQRPIMSSPYQIKNGNQEGSDFPHRNLHHLPSNSSSFTFVSPTFPPGEESPTSIGKPLSRVNFFNFLRDVTPSGDIPQGESCKQEKHGDMESSKAEMEPTSPFYSTIPEKMEPCDTTPVTPVLNRDVSYVDMEVACDGGAKQNRPYAVVRQLKENGFISNSLSKMRSFVRSQVPVHL